MWQRKGHKIKNIFMINAGETMWENKLIHKNFHFVTKEQWQWKFYDEQWTNIISCWSADLSSFKRFPLGYIWHTFIMKNSEKKKISMLLNIHFENWNKVFFGKFRLSKVFEIPNIRYQHMNIQRSLEKSQS